MADKEEIEAVRRGASAYIDSHRHDPHQQGQHLKNLLAAQSQLNTEIQQRNSTYLTQLTVQETNAIEAKRSEVYGNPAVERAFEEEKANRQAFEDLRRVNGGAFPRNISLVLYLIPLFAVGVAEWYVNYSTFAEMFIPVFAIAATLIVAAVFAWASHMHGSYLKQISEILHPSVEYRNVLGRKIALVIATVLLIAAFFTVVWLRYLLISDQLGGSTAIEDGVFGGAGSSLVWSKVAPTIVLNVLIWGLGTLYAWALNEKVPGLREAHRHYLRASKVVQNRTKPFFDEQKRLRAYYDRLRENNAVAIEESNTLLESLRNTIARLKEV